MLPDYATLRRRQADNQKAVSFLSLAALESQTDFRIHPRIFWIIPALSRGTRCKSTPMEGWRFAAYRTWKTTPRTAARRPWAASGMDSTLPKHGDASQLATRSLHAVPAMRGSRTRYCAFGRIWFARRPDARMRNEQSVALALCPRWGTSGHPISLAYLAGALRKRGHAVAAFDLNVEFVAEHRAFLERQETDADLWGYPEKYRTLIEPLMYPYLRKWADRILRAEPAAVCFSTYWSNRYPTHALAQLIKERDSSVRIIMGGPDCAVAENGEATGREPDVDAIVHGEGEGPLVEVLAAGARPVPGALVKRGSDILSHDQPSEPVRLDSLPFPDFSVFELASYDTRHVLPLVTSRGC